MATKIEIEAVQLAAHLKVQEDSERARKRDAEMLAAIRENMPTNREEFVSAMKKYREAGGHCRLETEFAAALLKTGTYPSMINQFVAILGYTEWNQGDSYYTEPVCRWLGKHGELDSLPELPPIPQGW